MNALPPAAERVRAAAQRLGLSIHVRELMQSTRTAEEAAIACGCPVGAIVKSLVFIGWNSGIPLLLLVSGQNRVDETLVQGPICEPLARPDAKAVRAWTGFAIGGIPPFGHDEVLKTFIDADLLGFDRVWAAAGTPRTVFAIAPKELARATKAETVWIA